MIIATDFAIVIPYFLIQSINFYNAKNPNC